MESWVLSTYCKLVWEMYKDLQGHLAIRVARTSALERTVAFHWHIILKLGVQIGVQLAKADIKQPHPANQTL
jgi:hypothetical protein